MARVTDKRRGRKSIGKRPHLEIDPSMVDAICNALRAGAHIQTACAFVGVDAPLFERWMKKGRNEILRRIDLDHKIAKWDEDDHLIPPTPDKLQKRMEYLEEDEKVRESREAYVKAVRKVEKAVADAEMHAVAAVSKAATTDWRAAAWILERRHGKRWSQKMIENEISQIQKENQGQPVTWVDIVRRASELQSGESSAKRLRANNTDDGANAEVITIEES